MKFNNIFNSNMVFAAGKPIRIYGSGCGKGVISADISETDDIHPPTKDKLAVRIADALNKLLH